MTMYIKPYRGRRFRIHKAAASSGRDVHVPINVKLEGQEYLIEMIVPGLTPEDLDIEIHKNQVSVKGEFPAPVEDDPYLHQEIPTGRFQRVIKLSKALEADESDANLENGILSLRVPVAEGALPRTIEVQKK